MLIRLFIRELFYALTAAMVLAVVLELLWPGIVRAYLNVSQLYIFWLFCAIITVLIRPDTSEKS